MPERGPSRPVVVNTRPFRQSAAALLDVLDPAWVCDHEVRGGCAFCRGLSDELPPDPPSGEGAAAGGR